LPHAVLKRSPPPGYSPLQMRTVVLPGASVHTFSPSPMRRTPYQQYVTKEEAENGLKHGTYIKV